MENTTQLFQDMVKAEAAFRAAPDGVECLPLLYALEAAEKVYFAELAERRAEWKALPEGERKDSAEQNAYDTEGCAEDELRWFEIAIGTFGL